MSGGGKHRWGEPVQFPYKTERACIHCPIVKVTHHQNQGAQDYYWNEYWRDGEKITGSRPACVPVNMSTEEGAKA